MPEGDTIHRAAHRMRPILAGSVPDELLTPHPRFGRDDWPGRLRGQAITAVDARGKHLFIRFEGGLVIHSHLRMTGVWDIHDAGRRWRRAPHKAWLVLRSRGGEAVQFDGPVLELMTAARARSDPRIAQLGPDIVAPEEFDVDEVLRRLRHDDPTRPIGDALLDQRIVAGLGTIWRTEACFAAAVDPHRPTGKVADEEVASALGDVRPRMQSSVLNGHHKRDILCYGRSGQPCPRCGTPLRGGTLGDDNRPAYWCPACQA